MPAAADAFRFLGAFLRHPLSIGAVAPSSAALARAMVRGLVLRPGDAVIEFGPGTGPFTAEIARLLPGGAGYMGIERRPEFVELLRGRYPRLHFVADSAENAVALAGQAGLGRVRAVLCGLPFASLPASVQEGIVAALDRLIQPGAVFRTFQYVHAWPLPAAVGFRRRMRDLFGAVHRSPPVWGNLPPAFVLTWRR